MEKIDKILFQNAIEYNKIRNYCFRNRIEYFKIPEYEKILNARYHKNSRIKKRLIWLILNFKNIWFCTFTINNNFINKSERTKRDYLKKYLNNYDFKFILNVDFGKQGTERQHYHCILATNEDFDINIYFQDKLKNFGFSKSLKCLSEKSDFERITKYINKLCNHAIKDTTINKRILYNFKGYDLLFKNQHELTLHYKLDYYNLFEKVPLLDKGDVNGNFGGKNEKYLRDTSYS